MNNQDFNLIDMLKNLNNQAKTEPPEIKQIMDLNSRLQRIGTTCQRCKSYIGTGDIHLCDKKATH